MHADIEQNALSTSSPLKLSHFVYSTSSKPFKFVVLFPAYELQRLRRYHQISYATTLRIAYSTLAHV